MILLLLKYMKVTDDALLRVSKKATGTDINISWGNLKQFGARFNLLGYPKVERFFSGLGHFDAILLGDIFWPTGQNICRWCQHNGVKAYFLQHGQWVYVDNKKNPPALPHKTMFIGDEVHRMCASWPYGQRSSLTTVGSPRYDDCVVDPSGQGIYFAPPVMTELNDGIPPKVNERAIETIEKLVGMDDELPIILHPHYREGLVDKLTDLFPKAKFVDPHADPLPVIQKCSKVLTHRNSTTMLDAIACGKISVLMNFTDGLQSHYRRSHFGEFALESYNEEHCKNHLKSINALNLDNYHERAKDHVYLGDSSTRILKAIKNG